MSGNAGQAAVAPERNVAAAPVAPNQYHLMGGGLSVSYFPDGLGPIGPAGVNHLIYQDAQAESYRVTKLTGTATHGQLPL